MASTAAPDGPLALYDVAIRSIARTVAARGGEADFLLRQHKVSAEMRLDVLVELDRQGDFIRIPSAGMWERVKAFLGFGERQPAISSLAHKSLGEWDHFKPLLAVGGGKRVKLHKLFHKAINAGFPVDRDLAHEICDLLKQLEAATDMFEKVVPKQEWNKTYADILNFSTFLNDGGLFESSVEVLEAVRHAVDAVPKKSSAAIWDEFGDEASLQLLRVLTCIGDRQKADVVYESIVARLQQEEGVRQRTQASWASHFSAFSGYFSFKNYESSKVLKWSMEALKMLSDDQPTRMQVDTLLHASLRYGHRNKHSKAKILLKKATLLAKEVYGETHPVYADCLEACGNIHKDQEYYEMALRVRQSCFGDNNLVVAHNLVELASTLHLKAIETTGDFAPARTHAEKALATMEKLLPENHPLLWFPKSVLGHVLHHMGDEMDDEEEREELFLRAEELLLSALELSIARRGRMDETTAYLFEFVADLYNDMGEWKQAEKMYLECIELKEKLHGKEDYHLRIPLEDLATLYREELNDFTKAEELYLRALDISVKNLPKDKKDEDYYYSKTEHVFNKLIGLYVETEEMEKMAEISDKLSAWKESWDLLEDAEPVGDPDHDNWARATEGTIKSVVAAVLAEGGDVQPIRVPPAALPTQ